MLVTAMAGVMIVAAIVIYRSLDIYGLSSKQFVQSHQVNNLLRRLETNLTNEEIGERDYLLNRSNDAAAAGKHIFIPNAVINPDSLLTYLPMYASQVNRLNSLLSRRTAFVAQVLLFADSGNIKRAAELLNTGRGRLLRDSAMQVINTIRDAENSRVDAVAANGVNNNRGIFILLSAGILLCLLLLVVFYLMMVKNAHLREKTEADLVAAKNLAEYANRAKTTFLATMSQEIRSPLHDIISTATLLEESLLTGEQQKFTGIMQRSSMALLAVVNDIIDFSNIENGKLPLENSAFILRDCLNEVLTVGATDTLINKINYEVDDQLPELIECDAVRLRQVLWSVIDSLLKNHITGNITCNARLLTEDSGEMEIEFTVLATPADDHSKQSAGFDKPGNNAYNNSLFGMSSIRFSIAARLVSLMGGNIKVTTDTDKNNTVVFSIKAKRVDASSGEKFLARRKDIKWLDNANGNKIPLHILVVDDHELNQALLVQMLTKMGYTCKTARNGVEAAGMAIEEKFDVIFMDISMPVMDGIDATRRIREYYVHTDTPLIIGVTANALLTEKQKGFDAGMNDFLIKPYKPVDIKTMLEKWTALVFKLKYEL
ncbi:MAG TPA: response regulator [Chitinophagaceae bacterium]|nr:response regulator [Chitinophagaceae bacterium]